MNRLITYRDEGCNSPLKVIEAIGGNDLPYNWLVSDPQISFWDKESELNNYIDKLNDEGYVFLSTEEIIKLFSSDNYIWLWGVISAIPKKYTLEDVNPDENFPMCDEYDSGDDNIWDNNIIQHPLAEIELLICDGSAISIVAKDEKYLERFKSAFPNSKSSFDEIKW